MKYIPADKMIAAIEKRLKNIRDYINGAGMKYKGPKFYKARGKESAYDELLSIIYFLQQEQPEVELEKLKNKAELIANEIMMGVQANKYHTCIYDKASNDFNHSHLLRAALKGIELGLNARKEESL